MQNHPDDSPSTFPSEPDEQGTPSTESTVSAEQTSVNYAAMAVAAILGKSEAVPEPKEVTSTPGQESAVHSRASGVGSDEDKENQPWPHNPACHLESVQEQAAATSGAGGYFPATATLQTSGEVEGTLVVPDTSGEDWSEQAWASLVNSSLAYYGDSDVWAFQVRINDGQKPALFLRQESAAWWLDSLQGDRYLDLMTHALNDAQGGVTFDQPPSDIDSPEVKAHLERFERAAHEYLSRSMCVSGVTPLVNSDGAYRYLVHAHPFHIDDLEGTSGAFALRPVLYFKFRVNAVKTVPVEVEGKTQFKLECDFDLRREAHALQVPRTNQFLLADESWVETPYGDGVYLLAQEKEWRGDDVYQLQSAIAPASEHMDLRAVYPRDWQVWESSEAGDQGYAMHGILAPYDRLFHRGMNLDGWVATFDEPGQWSWASCIQLMNRSSAALPEGLVHGNLTDKNLRVAPVIEHDERRRAQYGSEHMHEMEVQWAEPMGGEPGESLQVPDQFRGKGLPSASPELVEEMKTGSWVADTKHDVYALGRVFFKLIWKTCMAKANVPEGLDDQRLFAWLARVKPEAGDAERAHRDALGQRLRDLISARASYASPQSIKRELSRVTIVASHAPLQLVEMLISTMEPEAERIPLADLKRALSAWQQQLDQELPAASEAELATPDQVFTFFNRGNAQREGVDLTVAQSTKGKGESSAVSAAAVLAAHRNAKDEAEEEQEEEVRKRPVGHYGREYDRWKTEDGQYGRDHADERVERREEATRAGDSTYTSPSDKFSRKKGGTGKASQRQKRSQPGTPHPSAGSSQPVFRAVRVGDDLGRDLWAEGTRLSGGTQDDTDREAVHDKKRLKVGLGPS